ncbi:hypothetical protein [Pseudomonas aeruginosa]|uniref:hypothetical protein n=1 Tax=Pseudomonas aeruginosa TaxID=287 RepID=UPI00104505B1|nr:hypothetical protein [Pseudomonas aeruginosa]
MSASQRKPVFQFISSYRGQHDFGVHLPDGTHHRLRMRVCADPYGEGSVLSPAEWESQVNGCIGYVTCLSPEILTEELVAAFNSYKYSEWRRSYDFIAANPDKYGPYEGGPCNVVVGAAFNRETRRWDPLHEFEVIRMKAGIPAEFCVDARAEMRAKLALVA